ncbi:MAG: nickel pincer cofactor biosynthesis protein LarC [Acidobacteriota bacterium]
MKILYFDCFAGAAGDMILGALIDAGLPVEALERALGSLAVGGWTIAADPVVKGGIRATQFRVRGAAPVAAGPARDEHHHHHHHDHHHHHGQHQPPGHDHHGEQAERAGGHAHHAHHTLAEIHAAIGRSTLSPAGQARARALFDRLAEAEAAIHGMPVEQVHLHEVGATDSIIDIVGAVFAFEWFGVDRVVVSPMNVGGGMVRSAHGTFPVPAPATLRLLGQAPVYSSGVQAELLTPTGALLLSAYADAYGPMPAMTVTRVGYGAGERDLAGTPNVLRVVVGEAAIDRAAAPTRVVEMTCEIDDMNPQIYGALMDRLYGAGALDVFYQPVQMKKGRPGMLVTVIARPEHREALADVVFRETTTIGIRYQEMTRECLDREMLTVPTPVGDVRFKVARRAGVVLNAQPEFDDLAALSAKTGRPIKELQALAWSAWMHRG